MRLSLVMILFVLGTMLLPAIAMGKTVYFHMISSNISGHRLTEVERAIVIQLDRQVVKHWHIAPMNFGTNGIPITFMSASDTEAACNGAIGCHYDINGSPYIDVSVQPSIFETLTLDHEIIETMVDPTPDTNPLTTDGYLSEACDPVENTYYMSAANVALSDYVYPRWFYPNATGQMDYMGLSITALDSSFGIAPFPISPPING